MPWWSQHQINILTSQDYIEDEYEQQTSFPSKIWSAYLYLVKICHYPNNILVADMFQDENMIRAEVKNYNCNISLEVISSQIQFVTETEQHYTNLYCSCCHYQHQYHIKWQNKVLSIILYIIIPNQSKNAIQD